MVKMTFYLTFRRELAMMIERYSCALSKRARGCRADRVTRNRVFEGKKTRLRNTDGLGRGDAIVK